MLVIFSLLLFITTPAYSISISAGTINGVYVEKATHLCETKYKGKYCVVWSSRGSNENIRLLKDNKVDCAISQQDSIKIDNPEDYTFNKIGKEYVFLVTHIDNKNLTLNEILSKKAYTHKDSGSYSVIKNLLKNYNQDVNMVSGKFNDKQVIQKLCSKEIDYMVFVLSKYTFHIDYLLNKCKNLYISPIYINGADKWLKYYKNDKVIANGQEINTISMGTFLVCKRDIT